MFYQSHNFAEVIALTWKINTDSLNTGSRHFRISVFRFNCCQVEEKNIWSVKALDLAGPPIRNVPHLNSVYDYEWPLADC